MYADSPPLSAEAEAAPAVRAWAVDSRTCPVAGAISSFDSGFFGCCSIQAGMALLGCEREESASSLSAKFSSCRSARRMASDFRYASCRAVMSCNLAAMSFPWATMACSSRREDSSSSRRWRRRRMDAADLVVKLLASKPVCQWVGS